MDLERFIVFLSTIYSNKKQFFCYFLVGGLCALIDLSIFSIFTLLFYFPWVIVSVFSFCVATLINFILSSKFVFINRKANKKKEIIGVYIVSGIGLLINQFFLYLLIENANQNLIIAKITSTGIVFLWNYYSRKNLVFKS